MHIAFSIRLSRYTLHECTVCGVCVDEISNVYACVSVCSPDDQKSRERILILHCRLPNLERREEKGIEDHLFTITQGHRSIEEASSSAMLERNARYLSNNIRSPMWNVDAVVRFAQ